MWCSHLNKISPILPLVSRMFYMRALPFYSDLQAGVQVLGQNKLSEGGTM